MLSMWVFYLHQVSLFVSDTATLTKLYFYAKEITFLKTIFWFPDLLLSCPQAKGIKGEDMFCILLD